MMTSPARRSLALTLPLLIALACGGTTLMTLGCGGDSDGNGGNPDGGNIPDGGSPDGARPPNDPAARLIPGGGVGDGAISGTLHVHVIDSRAGTPLLGAAVLVNTPVSPLTGSTDATGLVTFRDGSLNGPQDVTVTSPNYVAATWVGVDGANLTIPLETKNAPTVSQAHATGTIQGWDSMPQPVAGHMLMAFIGYSAVVPYSSPENRLPQETVNVPGSTSLKVPTNLCLKALDQSFCSWGLNTRTGKQIHYAVIVDADSNGTLQDLTDDTYTVVDYAFLFDLDLGVGQQSTNEVLVPVGSAGLTNLSATFPTAPVGLGAVGAVPVVRMGEWGDLVLRVAPLGPANTTRKVPALAGGLATGTYDLLAHAKADAYNDYPSSSIIQRGISLGSSINLGAWMVPPTSLAAAGRSFGFTPAGDASFHTVRLFNGDTPVWTVAILDGTEAFDLPSVSPDPLPTGTVTMQVEASRVPGFTAGDFTVTTLADLVTHLAAGQR